MSRRILHRRTWRRRTCAVLALIAFTSCAGATGRTLVSDYTGLDCATNQDTAIFALPNLKSAPLFKAADLTEVHILGGTQFGPPVAFPNTDEEWARTWLHVRTKARKVGWAPAGVINCGG